MRIVDFILDKLGFGDDEDDELDFGIGMQAEENAEEILRTEVGRVFAQVLEHAGVYKRSAEGKAAFLRFVDYVNTRE